MERQGKGSRGLEAYCKGGQGPPRAVATSRKKKKKSRRITRMYIRFVVVVRLAWSNDPESYAGGSVATCRASDA